MITTIRGNPNLIKNASMPVFVETNKNGSMSFAMPSNAAPDSIGYSKNIVFQMERKTKMVARLRAKLCKE